MAMQVDLSSWVLAIVKSIQEVEIDADKLLEQIRLDASKIGDLTHRYSQEQVTALWMAASKTTADPVFGLKVARHVRPSTFHVVGYGMSSGYIDDRSAAEPLLQNLWHAKSAALDRRSLPCSFPFRW